MTYKRHWLLSFGGTCAAGQDIWSNNIRMVNDETAQPDGIPGGTIETLLDDFVSDIRAYLTNPLTYISNQVTCTWVKFNEINSAGHYADAANTHQRLLNGTGGLAPIFGTATTVTPSYQSVAVSLTTARNRGPGSLGRYFLPQCAAPMVHPGRLSTTAASALATGAKDFLNALADEAGVDVTNLRPAVVSNRGTPGPAEPVTGVKVGDVPDVIRRRKNNLIETYAKVTL